MINIVRFFAASFVACVALFASLGGARAQSCSFSMSNISFGNVDLTANSAIDTSGLLTASCAGASRHIVRICPSIADGTGGSNNLGSPRVLADGAGDQILYSLYQDPAHASVWGSWLWPYNPPYSAPTLDLPLGPAGHATGAYTVYARIFAAQQSTPPNSYLSSFAGSQSLMSYAYKSAGPCASRVPAGSVQAAFTVSAIDQKNCTVSASNLNFGTYGVLASNIDSTAAISVICSKSVAYTVGLDGGGAGATNPAQRKMSSGGASIQYGLYGDAARTQGWLNNASFYQASGVGTGFAQSLTVYGRVPPQATPAPATYADTVIVILTY